MIGKIVTGKSFKSAVAYVLKNDYSRLLDADGVDTQDVESVIDSFDFQRLLRPEIEKVVGHISLSFHPDDVPQATDDLMVAVAKEYMQEMEITDTQYIIVRHTNTRHPHLHFIYNRVRYDSKLVPDRFQYYRNVRVCKELTRKYKLTFSPKNVNYV